MSNVLAVELGVICRALRRSHQFLDTIEVTTHDDLQAAALSGGEKRELTCNLDDCWFNRLPNRKCNLVRLQVRNVGSQLERGVADEFSGQPHLRALITALCLTLGRRISEA